MATKLRHLGNQVKRTWLPNLTCLVTKLNYLVNTTWSLHNPHILLSHLTHKNKLLLLENENTLYIFIFKASVLRVYRSSYFLDSVSGVTKRSHHGCILRFKNRIKTVTHYGRFIELRKYIKSRLREFDHFLTIS